MIDKLEIQSKVREQIQKICDKEVGIITDVMYEVCSAISAQSKDDSLDWKLVDGVMNLLFKGLDVSADETAKNIRASLDKLRGEKLEDIVGKL